MGCNCSKRAKTTLWVYERNGATQTYNTEVEAKAAQIRAGGGGVVRPA